MSIGGRLLHQTLRPWFDVTSAALDAKYVPAARDIWLTWERHPRELERQ